MEKRTSKTIALLAAVCAFFLLSSLLFIGLFRAFGLGWMKTVFISLFTCFYHFAMRLCVGETVTVLYRNKEFPKDRFDFRLFGFEEKLYEILNVKAWKKYVVTAKPEQFDTRAVSPDGLLHNLLQAELVHRICAVLSFLPLFLIIPYHTPWAFILTSVFAGLIDLFYVMIQRYNRPRVLRHLELSKAREARLSH